MPTKSAVPAVHQWPVRVYYEDTDAGGVVYHSVFLNFLERARTEWLRGKGFGQDQLRADSGVLFVVRSFELQLKRPARLDDALLVHSQPVQIGRARLDVRHWVTRGSDLLVTGLVGLACIDSHRFVPTAIPDPIRALIEPDLGE